MVLLLKRVTVEGLIWTDIRVNTIRERFVITHVIEVEMSLVRIFAGNTI